MLEPGFAQVMKVLFQPSARACGPGRIRSCDSALTGTHRRHPAVAIAITSRMTPRRRKGSCGAGMHGYPRAPNGRSRPVKSGAPMCEAARQRAVSCLWRSRTGIAGTILLMTTICTSRAVRNDAIRGTAAARSTSEPSSYSARPDSGADSEAERFSETTASAGSAGSPRRLWRSRASPSRRRRHRARQHQSRSPALQPSPRLAATPAARSPQQSGPETFETPRARRTRRQVLNAVEDSPGLLAAVRVYGTAQIQWPNWRPATRRVWTLFCFDRMSRRVKMPELLGRET